MKFTRLLETYLAVAPGGWRTFPTVLTNWLGEKLDLRKAIRSRLPGLRRSARSFSPNITSPMPQRVLSLAFDEAALLTIDGVGEWATTTIGRGEGNQVRLLQELRFPHSLGLFTPPSPTIAVSASFREYKLMGLAPYGETEYASAIREHLVEVKAEGSSGLNLDYFNFLSGTTMTNENFMRSWVGRRADRRKKSNGGTWTSRGRSNWSLRKSCCGWPGRCAPLRAPTTCASRAAWLSIVWPTA